MLKLFKSTDKSYNSNGDKIIIPLKAKIYKEDNGDFYLDLETDLSYVNDLTERAIIVALTPQGEQAFRIANPQKMRNKIAARCYHVFFDSENYLIEDSYVVDKNCNDALEYLNNATSDVSPFTTSSDVNTIASFRCVRHSLHEAINVILERWGGHLSLDNFKIAIKNEIGQDNGVTVRYKKNLKDITCAQDWSDVVTKLLPVGKDGILLNALDKTADLYVRSDTQYELPYTKKINFSQDNILEDDYKDAEGNLKEDEYKQALIEDLKKQAQNYVNINCFPKVNYTLKANLEKITDIGDKIEVIDERLGVNIFTNVIAYEYDCIMEKYTEVEFGTFKNKLSNLVNIITANTSKEIGVVAQTIQADFNSRIDNISIDTIIPGVLSITKGGTGATNAENAITNLGGIPIHTSARDFIEYPCTISELIQAMPSPAILMIGVDSPSTTVTDLPCAYGILTIHKRSYSRVQILYNRSYEGTVNGNNFYFGNYNTNAKSVTWNKIFTSYSGCRVPIENGGTGAATAADALTNLGIFNLIYPVGSIYMSVNNVNPSTLFGGTWVRWGSGRVPVGVNTSDSDFSTVEKAGGEKSHTLTVNEMPSHNHRSEKTIDWGEGYVGSDHDIAFEASDNVQIRMEHRQVTDGVGMVVNYSSYTDSTGNNAAHNNLQPYITCYMWKRTA